MNDYEKLLRNIIEPLFNDYEELIIPASQDQIESFRKEATSKKVPQKAIEELVRFYKVSTGIPCLDSVSIHEINDTILYEFWSEEELWIGQRDMDMIRWSDGKFHLGSAGDLNYGPEDIFETLLEVIEKGFKDWYPNGYK